MIHVVLFLNLWTNDYLKAIYKLKMHCQISIILLIVLPLDYRYSSWIYFYVFKGSKTIRYNYSVTNVHKVRTIPSFIYKSIKPTTPETSDFDIFIEDFNWSHASVVISSSVIRILLAIVLYK